MDKFLDEIRYTCTDGLVKITIHLYFHPCFIRG